MGGAIGVDSVPAPGSRFWVELPLACRRSDGGRVAAPPFAGRRAVVLCTARATRAAAEHELQRGRLRRSPSPTPPTGVLDRLAANVGTDLLVLDLRVRRGRRPGDAARQRRR